MDKKSTDANKENKEDVPQDQDIIDAIKEYDNKSLKPTLLYLNKMNNEMINQKEEVFHNAYLDLKNKYELLYFDLYKKTRDIALNPSLNVEIDDKDYETYQIDKESAKENKEIKSFYLTVLQNSSFFTIIERDKPLLEKLIDMRLVPLENKVDFKVEFEFEDNEYFTNKVLEKTYFFDVKTEKIIKATGTKIEWKDEEKDPGYKKVTKTIRKKKSKETQTIIKHIDNFFDIFNDAKTKVERDYIEARFLKEDFFPNMLEYYMNIVSIVDQCNEPNCKCQSHKK